MAMYGRLRPPVLVSANQQATGASWAPARQLRTDEMIPRPVLLSIMSSASAPRPLDPVIRQPTAVLTSRRIVRTKPLACFACHGQSNHEACAFCGRKPVPATPGADWDSAVLLPLLEAAARGEPIAQRAEVALAQLRLRLAAQAPCKTGRSRLGRTPRRGK